MNTHEGYSKTTLDNTLVLLAGGGHKSLDDFLLKAVGGTVSAPTTFSTTLYADSADVGNLIVRGSTNLTGDTYLSTVKSGTWNGSTIAIAYGGTGATTAAGARTNLGLGTAATYGVLDKTSNYTVTNTGTGLTTERAIYYILGLKGYLLSASLFASNSATSTTAPTWSANVSNPYIVVAYNKNGTNTNGGGIQLKAGTNITVTQTAAGIITIGNTYSHGLSTKAMTVNGSAYNIYTSSSALPTFYAPTSAGTAGLVLISTAGTPGWCSDTIGSGINPIFVNNGVLTASTSAVGSTTKPIYLNNGVITELGSTIGSNSKPIYMNAGALTALSSTIGSTSKPVYLNGGTITALSATVGSKTKPVYMSSGTITASDATVGSGVIPIFISSGTLTASTSTVGSKTKPVYLSSGTITVSDATVGSTTTPIYMSSGELKASNSTIGSTSKPMYLNAGVMTALSATKGGTSQPVYLNAGDITACSATVGSGVIPVYMSSGTITASTSSVGAVRRITYLNAGTITAGDVIYRGHVEVLTAAATQAKVGTTDYYDLASNMYFTVMIQNANTYNGKITLNINGKGAKTVWINGKESSSSNKTLPAGIYQVYYDGTYYYFNTNTGYREAYLSWGGKNYAGSFGPIDAVLMRKLRGNRAAFVNKDNVTILYSRDSGATWTDYGATDALKTGMFTEFNGGGLIIGKAVKSTAPATNAYLLRIILATAGLVYSILNKFIIYISTNGTSNNWCTIDARLQSNKESSTNTWVTFANKIPISGWSGYNVINTDNITTYGNSKTVQYGEIRFTFGCDTGVSAANVDKYAGMAIYGINCYGGVGWVTPSTLASSDEMYTFDMSKNVTFPANVTATAFIGKLGTSNVGSGTKHMYLNAGTPTASSSTVGGTAKPIYLNAGTMTACSDTVGGAAKPIYMSSGTMTACSSTVGGAATPVYMSSGTITACSSTVGSGVIPTYLSSGTVTASSSTVGSGIIPMYLNAGTLTASASTVGSGVKPIYLNAGTLTASGSTVGGTVKPVYLSSGTITAFSTTVGGAAKPVYVNAGSITACSSTVGGTSKPVYMNAGTITALSDTVGSGTNPVYMNLGTITKSASTVGAADKVMYLNAGVLTEGNTIGNAALTLSIGTTDTANNNDFTANIATAKTYKVPILTYNRYGVAKTAYSSSGAVTLTTAAATNTNTPTISAKTTTASRYYAIEADKNGILYVNVPWTDNNTDTKVTVSDRNNDSWDLITFATSNATGQLYSTSGFRIYSGANATTTKITYLQIGNATATGTDGNKRGIIRLYNDTAYYAQITTSNTYTANRTFTLPNQTGTVGVHISHGSAAGASSDWSVTGRYIPLSNNSGLYYTSSGACIDSLYSATANTNGYSRITLGNSTAVSASAANANLYGALRLYGTGANYVELRANTGANRVYYLLNHAANVYSVGVAAAATAYGSVTQPVYVNANGVLTKCNAYPTVSDEKVTQTATTTSASYEVLFSETADNTTRTEKARKNSNLTFNPSTGLLTTTKLTLAGQFKNTAFDASTSNCTPSTEILTSYATDNGFADTNGAGIVYRRPASKLVSRTSSNVALFTTATSNVTGYYAVITGNNFGSTNIPVQNAVLAQGLYHTISAEQAYYISGIAHTSNSVYSRGYVNTNAKITGTAGTTSVTGYVYLNLGNNIASGTANNSSGLIRLYGTGTSYGDLYSTMGGGNGSNYGFVMKGGNNTSSLWLIDAYHSGGKNYAIIKGGYTIDAQLTLNKYSAKDTLQYVTTISTDNSKFAGRVDLPMLYVSAPSTSNVKDQTYNGLVIPINTTSPVWDPGSTLCYGGIHGGKDSASPQGCNLRIASWYGIGFYCTASSDTIPTGYKASDTTMLAKGLNSIYFNTRNGDGWFSGDVRGRGFYPYVSGLYSPYIGVGYKAATRSSISLSSTTTTTTTIPGGNGDSAYRRTATLTSNAAARYGTYADGSVSITYTGGSIGTIVVQVFLETTSTGTNGILLGYGSISLSGPVTSATTSSITITKAYDNATLNASTTYYVRIKFLNYCNSPITITRCVEAIKINTYAGGLATTVKDKALFDADVLNLISRSSTASSDSVDGLSVYRNGTSSLFFFKGGNHGLAISTNGFWIRYSGAWYKISRNSSGYLVMTAGDPY